MTINYLKDRFDNAVHLTLEEIQNELGGIPAFLQEQERRERIVYLTNNETLTTCIVLPAHTARVLGFSVEQGEKVLSAYLPMDIKKIIHAIADDDSKNFYMIERRQKPFLVFANPQDVQKRYEAEIEKAARGNQPKPGP